MSLRVFALLLLVALVGIIAANVVSAPDVPNPDPPQVAYVDQHEGELIEKVKLGDAEAAKTLIFVYEWDGKLEKKEKILKLLANNKKD